MALQNLAATPKGRREDNEGSGPDSQPNSDQEAPAGNRLAGRLLDSGLLALSTIAARYRIAADPFQIAHDLGLGTRAAAGEDIARAASRIGLRARLLRKQSTARLRSLPMPAIARMNDGTYRIIVLRLSDDQIRIADPITRSVQAQTFEEFSAAWTGELILITRRWAGAGMEPTTFGFRWFSASLWRYRKPLTQVMIASLFVQLFALVTPLFFQIVVDKVLVHRSFSTLVVIVVGLAGIGLFDVTLQFLRSYALSHTTSRIDVELGSRLFDHLLRLPLAFFEMRPAGQIVARMRELETIRGFLTGRGLSSVIDLLFTIVFVVVLFIYSKTLALIVLASLPIYFLIAVAVRPTLRDKLNERFNTAAASQQFLVESIFGIQTLKAAAVEPILRNEWEDRLAAYVRSSFQAVILSNLGQNAITYVNKATTAAVLFFGAKAVINAELTVGELIAFYMIMNQATAPILRLSQLWQDFQQVQISVQRLGDVLNAHPESQRLDVANLPPARGEITIDDVTFRYQPDAHEVIKGISLKIPEGQVLGIVGPSGSGKSTLTKLIQRLYRPDGGQILVDGMNIEQVDTAWLRRQIGVVLQENTLFNRTIHENIALANPGMSRAQVIAVARLSGADEFISKLSLGYDTRIEERGANLSGGQRQRIAIARALATDPRILIFDEATSALDYESERTIQSNMREIARGRTVLIIAHRLAAVRNADRIIAIDDGLLVEEGTHDELLSRPESIYGKLWRMQARGD
ncbi:MAG TPA: type I secretion system permease/ATPase [Lacipirellulaceae bacterium]|nr:type I secretion system permease/ATPase [Lacipirellulaceae bacterium]